jgi:hypothetical protein
MNRILSLIALTLLSAGCATGVARMHGDAPVTRYQPYLGAPIEQFTAFRIDGWELAGHNQVVIWTGVNTAYLLTVWDSCQDLDFAQHIGISRTGSTVHRLESVTVGRQRCPIESIRPIDIRQYKADSAALREKKK